MGRCFSFDDGDDDGGGGGGEASCFLPEIGFESPDLRDRGGGDRRDLELDEESELTVIETLNEGVVIVG